MAKGTRDSTVPFRMAPGYETWTIATADVVAFVLVLVLVGHAVGALEGALSDVGTIPGVLAFAYLWALVLAATRWVLSAGGLERIDAGDSIALIARGATGGALAGAGFVSGAGLAVGVVVLAAGGGELLSVALLTLFGAVGGAVGGLVVGLVFSLVNVALYRISGRLVADVGE